MKRIVLVIVFILFSFTAYAEDYQTLEGESFFNDTVAELKNGDMSISVERVISYIYDTIVGEVGSSRDLLLSIFVIALLSGVIGVFNQGTSGVNEAAFFACFCLMTIAVIRIIILGVGYASDVIGGMTAFVTKLAPMLAVLLVSSGYTASAAAFYPVFSSAVWVISTIMEKCIVPLIYIGCVTGIVNNISQKARLDNMNRLIKSFSRWILTGVLTIFSAINAIYGFCTPTLDGVGIKTIKYAVGSIVPVVGGFLSESIETVIGGAHLIKNAAGTAGIITLIVICAAPALKITAIMIMLKLASALIEPVSDKRYSDMINEAAEAVTSALAALLIVTLLFILSIAIIIASTNTMV